MTNPISAYKDASDHGGNTTNAILDPQQLILKSGPRNTKEANEATADAKAKARKKRKKKAYESAGLPVPPGMKKGGKVKGNCCRGMGCATRGGNYK